MAWFVYIVTCKDGSFYTGITWNLKNRVSEHNSRIKSCLQKSKVPVKLTYWEKFLTKQEAAKKEKAIKGWSHKKKENLISSLHRVKRGAGVVQW